MASSEVHLNGEDEELKIAELSVDDSTTCAETSLETSVSLDLALMESSLNFAYPTNSTDNSFHFYMDNDCTPFEQLEPTRPDQHDSPGECTSSKWLSSAAEAGYVNNSNSVSYSTSSAGTTIQTSPVPFRQVAHSMTAITLHSTPISTPVKRPLFRPETSPAESDIYLSFDSTSFSESSLALGYSTLALFDESSSSSLFLQEPTLVNTTKKSIVEVAQPECCNQFCLLHLTAAETNSTLEYFKSKNISDQNQFLLDSFRVSTNKQTTHHIICGKHVCKGAYIRILQISEKRYNHALKLLEANPTVKIKRKLAVRSESTKVTEAKAWLARYIDRIGDSMPHVDQIHLPHGLTKRDIYYNMRSQLQEQGLSKIVSLSHFYSIWNTSFEKVSIPKV